MTVETTSDPGRYHHGNLARALLDAVEEIVDEVGVGELTLRETARRAGVTHSAPAHHFGDLQGMLDAFALEGFRMLGAEMTEAIAGAEGDVSPDDYLVRLGSAYLRFAMDHPAHYQVMFRQKHDEDTHVEWDDSDLGRAADGTFGFLAVVVGQLVADGVIRPENGRYAASMLWGMVHGVASLWIDNILTHFYEDHTPEQVVEGIMGVTRRLLETPRPD